VLDKNCDVWLNIKESSLPVVLYGIGDGADRILEECEKRSIRVCGVFTSSERVHKKIFHQYRLLPYEEAKRIWGRMTVIQAFGTHDEYTLNVIKRIASENDYYTPSLLKDEKGEVASYSYYKEHEKDIEEVESALSDEKSKKILSSIISFRISGRINYVLDVAESDKAIWSNLNFNSDETFLDLGAYDGDTVERFLSLSGGKYSAIYGFEPDEKNFNKLKAKYGDWPNIKLFNAIVSSFSGTSFFQEGSGRGSKKNSSGKEIETVKLDDISFSNKPTLIKFDTEGEEENILDGARKIIAEDKPKLILSVYHKADDLWRLLRSVKEINPSYRSIKLRQSRALPDWDTVYLIE